MNIFGGGGGGGSGKDADEKRGPQNKKAGYDDLRKALEDERALLRLMTQLEPKEFERLMEASKEYAQAYKSVHDAQREQAAVQRQQQTHQFAMERARADNQMMHQLEEKRTQEEKHRTDYQLKQVTAEQERRTMIKLEAKKRFEALETERHKREEAARQRAWELEQEAREREFQRQERMMKAKLEAKARMERENELALAKHKLEQHKLKHEAEKGFLLEKAKTEAQIRADSNLAAAKARYEAATTFFTGPEGRDRMQNAALAVGLSAAGVYSAKTVYPIAQRALTNYFFKPQLVNRRVVHRATALGRVLQRAFSSDPAFQAPAGGTSNGAGPHVVLPPALQSRMKAVIDGTRVTAARGGHFGHMLLWGKPGTGKTLFAEKMAMECEMDFAVMSGPSFDQFHPKDAIVEIKELFKWANRSKRPVLLFVDEADSFLEDRSTLHPDRVRVLNEFINQTGTESRNFMLCYETNRPEVLDPAVQSRVTRAVEFPHPGAAEIEDMLRYYVSAYIANAKPANRGGRFSAIANAVFRSKPKPVDISAFDDDKYVSVAERLKDEGFVGRDVTNFVIALAQEMYAAENFSLTPELIETVVERQVEKKRQDKRFAEARSSRIAEHFQRLSNAKA